MIELECLSCKTKMELVFSPNNEGLCYRLIHLRTVSIESPTLTPHDIRGMPAGRELDREIGARIHRGTDVAYSSSLSIWTLVDTLLQNHNLELRLKSSHGTWAATFYPVNSADTHALTWRAIATTRPLAIARAALLVLVEVEGKND